MVACIAMGALGVLGVILSCIVRKQKKRNRKLTQLEEYDWKTGLAITRELAQEDPRKAKKRNTKLDFSSNNGLPKDNIEMVEKSAPLHRLSNAALQELPATEKAPRRYTSLKERAQSIIGESDAAVPVAVATAVSPPSDREGNFMANLKATKDKEKREAEERVRGMGNEEREKYEADQAKAKEHEVRQQAHLNRLAVGTAGGKKVVGGGRGGRGGRGRGGRGPAQPPAQPPALAPAPAPAPAPSAPPPRASYTDKDNKPVVSPPPPPVRRKSSVFKVAANFVRKLSGSVDKSGERTSMSDREKDFFEQQKAAKDAEKKEKADALSKMSPEEREKHEAEAAEAAEHNAKQQAHYARLVVGAAGGKKVIGRGGGRGRGRGRGRGVGRG